MKKLKKLILGIILLSVTFASIGCDQSSDPIGVWKVKTKINYTASGEKTITYPRVNVDNKDIDGDGELEYLASHNYIEVKTDRLTVAVETELNDPGEPCEFLTVKDGEIKPMYVGTNVIENNIMTTTSIVGDNIVNMIFKIKISGNKMTLTSSNESDQKVKYVLEKVEEGDVIAETIESGY